jgi:hypothetical protein
MMDVRVQGSASHETAERIADAAPVDGASGVDDGAASQRRREAAVRGDDGELEEAASSRRQRFEAAAVAAVVAAAAAEATALRPAAGSDAHTEQVLRDF